MEAEDVPSGWVGLVEGIACFLKLRAARFPRRAPLLLARLSSKRAPTLANVSGFPRLLQLFGRNLLACPRPLVFLD